MRKFLIISAALTMALGGYAPKPQTDAMAEWRQARQGSPSGVTAEEQRVADTEKGRAEALPHSTDICERYVGQTVAPKPFDAAVARFANLTPKGEFETTAEYDARKTSVLGDAIDTIVISKDPEDREFFEYNADTRKLTILSYVFDNTNRDFGFSKFRSGYSKYRSAP
jgi:hypothetical protein